jgi:2-C-methyl-D-erythritol 4-phosphate cytidylyltransferase
MPSTGCETVLSVSGAVAAIIPAAGAGVRLGTAVDGSAAPKALRMLAGRTLLQRSVAALADHVDQVVVAVPADSLDLVHFHEPFVPVLMVAGGLTRQRSVSNALAALPEDVEYVLVHDAARPLVPSAVVRRVLAALRAGGRCVVPVIAAHDSLRWLNDDGSTAPLDRARARLVQTPQGFAVDALRAAHASAVTELATDDASLVESCGETVILVEGDPRAFKITEPLDLLVAEALLAR